MARKFLAVFLCIVIFLGTFPASVTAQEGPIAQAVTIQVAPVFKLGHNGLLELLGTIPSGTRVGIYSFGHYFYDQEYVKNDPINQYIKRSDLYILTGQETKSDRRPCQVIDTTIIEGGKINWYQKLSGTPVFWIVPLAAYAVANDGTVIGVIDDVPVATVIIVGVGTYAVYTAARTNSQIVKGLEGLRVWAAEEFRHHILEGERANQRLELLRRAQNKMCTECWYRNETGRDEAIALIFVTDSFRTGGHWRNGVTFIHNRSNPNFSTILAGATVPAGFDQQLPVFDRRCIEAMVYMAKLASEVLK